MTSRQRGGCHVHQLAARSELGIVSDRTYHIFALLALRNAHWPVHQASLGTAGTIQELRAMLVADAHSQ